MLGLACAESGQSVFSSMATRRNLTDQVIAELILESDFDTHSYKDISAQSDSDTGDTTDRNFAH